MDILEEVLAVRSKALPHDDMLITETHLQLGSALMREKKFDEAMILFTNVFPNHMAAHGGNNRQAVALYNNMAH